MAKSCTELGQLITAIQAGAAHEVRKHLDIAVEVLDEDQLIAAGSTEGLSALGIACRDGSAEIASILLQHPLVDPNFAKRTTTNLMLAAARGHAPVVRLLLGHARTDANLKRRDGVTALMLAVQQQQADITRLLLQHPRVRPSIKALFPERVTPLILAIKHRLFQQVALLLQCDRMLVSENMWMRETPLDYAKSLGGSNDIPGVESHVIASNGALTGENLTILDLLDAFDRGGFQHVAQIVNAADRLHDGLSFTDLAACAHALQFDQELAICDSLLSLQLPPEASAMVRDLSQLLRSRGLAPAAARGA